jgi:hypothetical protein
VEPSGAGLGAGVLALWGAIGLVVALARFSWTPSAAGT